MISIVTPEVVNAHYQDLMAEAEEQRRARGDAPARARRHGRRWSLHRAA